MNYISSGVYALNHILKIIIILLGDFNPYRTTEESIEFIFSNFHLFLLKIIDNLYYHNL